MTLPTPSRLRRERLETWWAESYIGTCWRRSDDLDLPTASLALGAQEVLCTAPLLVALSAIMARFHLGYVGGFLHDLLGLDQTSSDAIRNLFRATRTPDLRSLWVGLATTVVFYIAVAASTQRAVDAIWGQVANGWNGWWRRIVWVCGQLPMFGASVFGGRYFHASRVGVDAANMTYAIALGFSAALFHWWGHWLLLKRAVGWRDLAPGSVAIGLGVFALVASSPFFMATQITDNVADYGLIGAAFVLSLWSVTYSSIVVFGTLLGEVYVRRGRTLRRLRA